jgi:ATP-dependent Lhr-like helicase
VASLLQRIGRGNRRSGRIFALGIPATPEDSQQFIMLFTLATSESLDTRDYTPKLGVAVQQTFSYLLQRRDIKTTRKNLARILKPLGLDEDDTQAILANLVKLGWIEIDAYGGILAGQKLEKDFRYGKMHSSIPDRGAWTVVDEAGSRIGFVTEVTPVFLIGGKARKVLRMDYRHQKVYVRTIPTRKGDLLLSGGATSDQGKYFTLLPGNLHEKSRMYTTAKQGHDQARGQGEKR